MNSHHHHPLPQAPPPNPHHNDRDRRRPHMPYTPPPPSYPQPPPYPAYGYHYPHMQYQQRPPPQWAPYPMPMQMGRGYQHYPQMNPYAMPPSYPPMRPHLPQYQSSSSIQSHPPILSPSPSDKSFVAPPSLPPPQTQPQELSPEHVARSPSLAPPPELSSSPRPALPTPSPTQIAPILPSPARTPSPERTPFYPPLPWQSFEGEFPTRRARRRRKPLPQSSNDPVELPQRDVDPAKFPALETPTRPDENAAGHSQSDASILSQPSSDPPSTQPTTPSSTIPPPSIAPKVDGSTRSVNTILPVIPAVPSLAGASRVPKTSSTTSNEPAKPTAGVGGADPTSAALPEADKADNEVPPEATNADAVPAPRAPPKSWADLVRSRASAAANDVSKSLTPAKTNGIANSRSDSLAEALASYNVAESKEGSKVAFLEPRGLVNTGNMCYMNSVLQVLAFCVPFYAFLESIGRRAAHSFKSDTPMLDAMIMFVREFKTIDAAISVDQLRMRLKDKELEQYGEAFIPEFVYEVIRQLPRFSSMRRGHQQDAEEFLGFLLEELHDECSKSMQHGTHNASSGASTPTNDRSSTNAGSLETSLTEDSGWLEVGPKQKAAITRSSGHITTESPVTKIFGGKLRSELKVPGMKSSVTLEPYQPLQLDIGSPHVNNIIDALKGLTKIETLHGDFNSPRGPGSTATKQVTIETLPQVLILHLKRFQYDNAGGTQKIWKKIGYPLELELPKEVFPQSKRGAFLSHGGLPKYRLISVVYHHGKNASGGHYTVDVRRQEGREWIRLDDTVIRRIRSEDVAEAGSEEDPKVLAAALEKHKRAQSSVGGSGSSNSKVGGSNVFEQIAAQNEDDDEATSTAKEKPWSQVNGSGSNSNGATGGGNVTTGKKWSGVIANGVSTPTNHETPGTRTPVGRSTSVKDNKVAYILFYQKIGT